MHQRFRWFLCLLSYTRRVGPRAGRGTHARGCPEREGGVVSLAKWPAWLAFRLGLNSSSRGYQWPNKKILQLLAFGGVEREEGSLVKDQVPGSASFLGSSSS